MLLLLSILAPLAAAVAAPVLSRLAGARVGWLLAAVPATLFVAHLSQIARGGPDSVTLSLDWIPALGIGFDLRLDGLSSLFCLIVLFVATFIFPYAASYLGPAADRGRFFSHLLLFTTGMLGLLLADNLIVLFVFWELTSIASYLLIGYSHEDEKARKKALQALLVTGFGGVAMLAGFILLATAGDSYRLSELTAQGAALAAHPLARYALPLILLGALTKSAQFPFQFWLPNAMAAPTPVSALLHSATMVKAGIFLLFALSPIYSGQPIWHVTLVATGAATLLLGAVTGLFQRDLKRILAFTTMAVLGMLTMLIGIGSEMALKSALLFMMGHALYKATLFMTAGSIDHETGTRDVTLLGGLRRAMPLTALAAGLAALSKGGFPPMLGFLGKEYVYKASTGLEAAAPWLTGLALVGNGMLLALAFKAGIHPFWSKPLIPDAKHPWSRLIVREPHEAPLGMTLGPLALAAAGLVLGALPATWTDALIAPALTTAAGRSAAVSISLWHGLSLPLLLSLVTFALGVTLYFFREWLWRRERFNRWIEARSTERIYDFSFAQFVQKSKTLTLFLQNGSMRSYLWAMLAATLALTLFALGAIGFELPPPSPQGIGLLPLVLAAAVAAAGIYAALAPSLIKALVALGIVGYGIALVYAYFGAPDLAITQLVVETLSVALLLFAASRMPQLRRLSSRRQRQADAALATVFGMLTFALVLKANSVEIAPTISAQLSEWSYALAKGKNIVNVILVDFRAIDTFGEIVVLSVAAIGVSACLDRMPIRLPAMRLPSPTKNPLLRTGAKLLLPVFIALSIVALYRGHNLPGGGFIGGLVFACGYTLHSMVHGFQSVSGRIRLSPFGFVALGLAVALGSAGLGPIAGMPFMSGLWLPAFELPLLGVVHLGSPLVFDIGVFLTVVGFSLQVVKSLQRSADAAPESASPGQEPKPAQPSNAHAIATH